MSISRRVLTGLLGLLLCVSAPLAAQQRGVPPGPPPNPLESVKSLKCTFVVSTHGNWPNGEPAAQVKSGAVLTMQFVDIDTQESTARVLGLATTGDIVAQLRGWNLHFLDVRATGGLMVTTVFGQQSRDGKLKAAYTRADYLPIQVPGFSASPEISQHYGECEIGPAPAAAPAR